MAASALLTRPRLIRAARYAAYGAALVLVVLVAAALVIPEFLDRRGVEAELQAGLSQAIHGKVSWDELHIRILPAPHGALRQLRAEIPATASVRAEEVDAYLHLLPLLRGKAEIASVRLSKPEVRIDLAPSAPRTKPAEEAPVNLLDRYRTAVALIHKFAPAAEFDVEDAHLDIRVAGMPPIRLRDLTASARTERKGMNIELTSASDLWSRLKLTAHVEFADLSGTADLDLAEAKPQPWLDHFLARSPVGVALPAANLRAHVRTDGKTNLECDFEARAPSVEIVRAAQRVQVLNVAIAGNAVAGSHEIALRLTKMEAGASKLAGGSMRYSLKDDSGEGVVEFDVDLAQAMDAARRLVPEKASEALEAIESMTGRAQGRASMKFEQSGWRATVEIEGSDSSIGLRSMPGPLKVASGSMNIGRHAVKIDRADLSMLDAHVVASATVDYGARLRTAGAISEGSVGENFLDWVWKIAKLPPQLALKAPIRIAAQRVVWSPKQPLEVNATALFDAGPRVAVALGWTPDTLDIRRATIKDGRSDAVVALSKKGSVLDGRFSGTLYASSVAAAMLKAGRAPSGSASGDMRVTFDREHPARISAKGALKAEALDLSTLLGRPVKIERVDLDADAATLRVREAAVNWAGQSIRLRGRIERSAGGPVIDAQLDSPGVVVDALVPAAPGAGESERQITKEEVEAQKSPAEEAKGSKLWPLPVTGRIVVRSDFVQYRHYKAADVAAALALTRQSARLELQRAELCGIAPQMTLEATPAGFTVAAHLTAQKQQLEQTARCLTDRGLLISGNFDLRADIDTHGKAGELLRNLSGKVSTEAREGEVKKFALLANILSMKNIADLLETKGPKIDESGFPYRSLAVRGHFQDGRFVIDESALNSAAVGLAATGWISVADFDSRLSVLVAPFSRLNQVARGVPIVGYVIGGTLTSIPVGVSGDIRDPLVVPLGPGAITSELKGIFERTVKLPTRLVPGQRGDAQGPQVPAQNQREEQTAP